MFDNTKEKLKTAGMVVFVICVLASIVGAIVMLVSIIKSEAWLMLLAMFGVLIGGPILGYVAGLLLYGFGVLLENTEKESSPSAPNGDPKIEVKDHKFVMSEHLSDKEIEDKIQTKQYLYSKGVITKEEYEQAVKELKKRR